MNFFCLETYFSNFFLKEQKFYFVIPSIFTEYSRDSLFLKKKSFFNEKKIVLKIWRKKIQIFEGEEKQATVDLQSFT